MKLLKEQDDAEWQKLVDECNHSDDDDEEEEDGGHGGDDGAGQKKEMLPFPADKLIPVNEIIDLDNGTYEVKYKVETDEDCMVWVYY